MSEHCLFQGNGGSSSGLANKMVRHPYLLENHASLKVIMNPRQKKKITQKILIRSGEMFTIF